jgi:hypothetical protein
MILVKKVIADELKKIQLNYYFILEIDLSFDSFREEGMFLIMNILVELG